MFRLMRQMIGKQWKKLCKPNILMVKLIVGIQLNCWGNFGGNDLSFPQFLSITI